MSGGKAVGLVTGLILFILGTNLAASGNPLGIFLMLLAVPLAIVPLLSGSQETARTDGPTPGKSNFKLLFNTPNKKGTVEVSRAWFDQAQIRGMDGAQFELWVAEAMSRQGWVVEVTPTSGDYGADLVATKGGQRTAVQVKRYDKQVGISAVQQVMGGAVHWNCTGKMVVTSASDFTPAAKKLANATGTRLVTGREVERWRHTRRVSADATPKVGPNRARAQDEWRPTLTQRIEADARSSKFWKLLFGRGS